jgi:hypothetical protein
MEPAMVTTSSCTVTLKLGSCSFGTKDPSDYLNQPSMQKITLRNTHTF